MAATGLTKAYRNLDFLNSPDARLIRLLAEYLEPDSRMQKSKIQDTIVFFGSARTKSPEQAGEIAQTQSNLQSKSNRTPSEEQQLTDCNLQLRMSKYYTQARELASRLTTWAHDLPGENNRFVLCSGGGPGIMEAVNRGASDADGLSIGLNISLPFEQQPNPYITQNLSFEFHYFFMRKLWFVYLARAMVIFPGGFGTFDEMMEVLTLVQTRKLKKQIPIILFGSEYWDEVLNFNAMVNWGMICPEDLDLFYRTDSVDEAYDHLKGELTRLYL